MRQGIHIRAHTGPYAQRIALPATRASPTPVVRAANVRISARAIPVVPTTGARPSRRAWRVDQSASAAGPAAPTRRPRANGAENQRGAPVRSRPVDAGMVTPPEVQPGARPHPDAGRSRACFAAPPRHGVSAHPRWRGGCEPKFRQELRRYIRRFSSPPRWHR